MLTVGQTVQAKLKSGLHPWVAATVVALGRCKVTVELPGGRRYDLPPRQVRPARRAEPERCRVCTSTGHRTAKCPQLQEHARRAIEPNPPLESPPYEPPFEGGPAQPKDLPIRSERYLAFVRSQPCMWCLAPGPSDPDHVGPHGIGTKTDDVRTVPMCRKHHEERHRRGRVAPHSVDETMRRIAERQVDLLVRWLKEGSKL